jgi:hypothetical protein
MIWDAQDAVRGHRAPATHGYASAPIAAGTWQAPRAACYGCPHRGRPPRRARRRGPLKIYAHCIDGLASAAKQRTTDAPQHYWHQPEPGSEEDGDSKKAS